jgi:hypothetical protein
MEHPDTSTLLAYIRHQLAESESGALYQHLSRCPQCAERWKEYGQISSLLSKTLKSEYWNQPYAPGVLSERVFAHIEHPEEARLARQQRQREQLRQDAIRCCILIVQPFVALFTMLRRKPSSSGKRAKVPVISIPAIAFLIMLVGIVAIAYSFRGSVTLAIHPSAIHGSYTTPQTNSTILGHKSSSTTGKSSSNNTAANAANPTQQTATGGAVPTISLCTQGIDSSSSRIRICGTYFPVGDRVELVAVIGGSQSRPGRPVVVNQQGDFVVWWTITNCKQAPTVIYAHDVSSRNRIDTAVLQNIVLAGCFVPSPSRRGTGPNLPPQGPPNPGVLRKHH